MFQYIGYKYFNYHELYDYEETEEAKEREEEQTFRERFRNCVL